MVIYTSRELKYKCLRAIEAMYAPSRCALLFRFSEGLEILKIWWILSLIIQFASILRALLGSLAGPVLGYYSPEEKVFQLKRSEGVNVLDYLDINIWVKCDYPD